MNSDVKPHGGFSNSERRALEERGIFIPYSGRAQVDLHGCHPDDDGLYAKIAEAVQAAYEKGLPKLIIVHGHGHNRAGHFNVFANSNTGYLGKTVRGMLRNHTELRQWMFAKFSCSHDGSTTVRLRPPQEGKTVR